MSSKAKLIKRGMGAKMFINFLWAVNKTELNLIQNLLIHFQENAFVYKIAAIRSWYQYVKKHIAVTSYWAGWRLKSQAPRLFTQSFVHAQIEGNIKAPCLAFVKGIHRWPVNCPRKRPLTRKMFLSDDTIMTCRRIRKVHNVLGSLLALTILSQGYNSSAYQPVCYSLLRFRWERHSLRHLHTWL